MTIRRAFIVICGLLAVLVGVGIAAIRQSQNGQSPQVTFLHFTNDAPGSRWASFKIANHSGCDVIRWKLMGYESQKNPNPATRVVTSRNQNLAEGDSEVISVPIPQYPGPWSNRGPWTNSSPWKARFYFTQANTGRKIARIFPANWRPKTYRELSPDIIVKTEWLQP